jgi:uncharacterized protein (UPF0332 family)
VTEQQRALVDKASDSLQAARLLHEHGQHSFAASRAYYAMFYLAEAVLLGEGKAFSKHAAVHAAFGERYAKTGLLPSELHRYLIEGMEQIARAEEFLRVVSQHLGASQQDGH